MEERYLSTREFAKLLGVSRIAVIKWIKSGRIVAYNVNGRWRIPYSEVGRVLGGVERVRRMAIYARVSPNARKEDLERQVEALKLWVFKNFPNAEHVVVTDIASGLREDRDGLKNLVEMARRREIQAVVVAYRDRLTRFGFEYLKTLFSVFGIDLYVAFQEEPKEYLQELVEDFVEIVESLASRIYGRRSKKYREVVRCVRGAIKGSD
ncbi:MAG: IS607 family transposase [Desulfurococcales archaeon]|jgi:excisionase family DNA binding protein|nr:IS607 family transposase [Desulfurococcales archaeon]